jgi:hypothetical protein
VNKLAKNLMRQARKQVREDTPDAPRNQIEAQASLVALNLAELKCEEYSAAQGEIVRHIAEKKLWKVAGHRGLRQFLRETGLSDPRISNLLSLGTIIVPFCAEHNIEVVEEALEPANAGKLREAIPTLRKAVKADDVEAVTETLAYVVEAPGRDAVRETLVNPRPKLGYGITVAVDEGELVLAARITATPEEIEDKLGRMLELNNGCDRTQFVSVLASAINALVAS